MIYLYFLLLFILSIFSYSHVDPNITLINHPLWEVFRNNMVYLGYYQRGISSSIYIIIVCLLFYFHYFFIKRYKTVNLFILTSGIVLALIASYPFLSHDFFNYLFDAKILTVYGKNPYLYKALDFPKDPWLIFMHWTHRTYPYGPFFLGFSLIPSFLSFGKLILNFIFFKFMFAGFYILGVYYLNKINKKYALFFATSPLVLIEGLVNAHNDMVGIFLAFVGIMMLWKSKRYSCRILFLFSFLIKYISLPVLFVTRKKSIWTLCSFILLHILIVYLGIRQEIQAWYFLNLFIFIPWYFKYIKSLTILYIGLLISYYPYIRLDAWNGPSVQIKHTIILVTLGITAMHLLYVNRKNLKLSFFKR